jgi:hypothetical protein
MSSTTISLSKLTPSTTHTAIPFPIRGLATIVTAVAANVLLYFAGSVVVPYDPEFVVLANVSGAVLFTFVAAVVAVLLYAGLRRFTRHPARIFKAISAVVFVFTLIPDFIYIPTVPGSSPGQTAILVLMHIVAACVIVPILTAADDRS